MSSKEVSTVSDNSSVSNDIWTVPVVGNLSTAEYRKLRRLLHDLGRRNIYMRFKYVARLYHSGMLEKLVDFLNETGGRPKGSEDEAANEEKELPDAKRKRSDDEEENEEKELPDAKRKAGDDAQTPESNENKEDDSALTDYDSDDGDSSDEDEDEEKDGIQLTEGLFRSLYRSRRHVSTQTGDQSDSD